MLRTVIGVEVEVEHVPIYVDQPLFTDVDTFMRSQGFIIYDLKHYYWKRNVPGIPVDSSLGDLVFADALYFRPPEHILQLVNSGSVSLSQAVCCFLAYGYTHTSEVLVALAASANRLDPGSVRHLRDMIRPFRRGLGLSPLPRAGGVRSRLNRLVDSVFPPIGWAGVSKTDLGA